MHYSEHDREAGHRSVMRAAGLTARVFKTKRRTANGLKMFTEALRSVFGPTALVIYGSGRPSAALLAAVECGLRCPDDLSVVTFRGGPFRMVRSVTFVRVPDFEAGRAGVDWLLYRVEAGRRLKSRAISGMWVEGKTVGLPPPQSREVWLALRRVAEGAEKIAHPESSDS